MISVTPLWNRNRSSKPGTACTSQHKPQGDMQHSHPLSLPRVRVCHTHLRASPQRTAAQESRSPELGLRKKTLCKCLCVLVLHCFHPDDIKKVNMVTSPCRQDPFQKFLRNRDGTSVFDNCQQIWFEFLRTRVDEVRRTRTGNHTSPTLPWKWKTARVYIHWRILLVSLGPLPLTQSRQEHVHRVRRTHKGLVCIYVGGVCRHVGGFQPHEPTQMQKRMTQKCDIWPHLTPLHTAHTHITSQRVSLTEQHSNSVVLQMAKTSPVTLRSRWPHRQHRAHQTKTCQKRCLQTFRQCNGASITYVVVVEEDHVDGVVCLARNQKRHTPGCTHASAERSHSCSAREHHTGRASFLFHSGIGLSPSAARVKRCAITPRHGVT